MGTWGKGLFENDTACDIRGNFFNLIAQGFSPPDASRWLVHQWDPDNIYQRKRYDDPDEARVIWLAIAAIQWRVGWLEAGVKERALRIIHDGSDLQGWIDETTDLDVAERRAVLEKLKVQLLSPQPEPMNKNQIESLDQDLDSW